MNYVPFVGFAPDADPTTPGVMVDCNAVIPTDRGFRSLPGSSRWELSVNPDATIAGVGSGVWGGANVYLAATKNKVWALQQYAPVTAGASWANWVDVSAPGDFTMFASARTFEQFGDYVVSAQGNGELLNGRQLQVYSLVIGENTAFATIDGAPQATIVVVASRFVMALGTNSGAHWDGWKCCARDNHTDWSLNAATGCAQGRLVDSPGPILAGISMGNDVLAFKAEAVYLARYTGAPEVWTWEKLPFRAGCVNARAVTKDSAGLIYFLGTDNLYCYDGAVIRPLMTGSIARWFAENFFLFQLARGSPPATQGFCSLVYDSVRNLIWIELRDPFQDVGLGLPVLLHMHTITGRWGKTLITGGFGSLNGLGSMPFDFDDTLGLVGVLAPTNQVPVMFEMAGPLRVFGGIPYSSVTGIPTPMVTTGDFGDVDVDTELHAVRVKFITAPATSTLTPMHRAQLDATLVTAAAVARSSEGRYDTWQNDRWHRLRFDLRGETEFSGYAIDADAVDVR